MRHYITYIYTRCIISSSCSVFSEFNNVCAMLHKRDASVILKLPASDEYLFASGSVCDLFSGKGASLYVVAILSYVLSHHTVVPLNKLTITGKHRLDTLWNLATHNPTFHYYFANTSFSFFHFIKQICVCECILRLRFHCHSS